VFDFNDSPVMAYDSQTNTAFVGASVGCNPSCFGVLRSIDLASGAVGDAVRLGHGFVNGIAADEAHGIIATTTELDFTVEFYDEKTRQTVRTVLQGATSQINSGTDVQFDPVHKLFFVGQPFSSTGPNSSIQVYDRKGVFVASINNLHLPVSPSRIALSPALRRGFVQSSENGSQLQIFSY
jgi:WD40 repeat protein